MRTSSYTPWIFATLVITVLLVYTLHKYDEVTKALQEHQLKLSNIHVPHQGQAQNIEKDAEKSLPNQDNSLPNQIDLKGAFEENRHIPQVAQKFEPDTLEKDERDYDYKSKLMSLIDKKVPADDPELIHIIRNHYIDLPSTKEYNLTFPNRVEFSQGQSPVVDSRLNYMEGGFYVECGALNGEKGSNSLFFEKVRKWNGLLIEGDPSNYAVLKTKHRKAFSANACLSPQPFPMKVKFNKAFNMGRAIHNQEAERWMKMVRMKEDFVEMVCFPLYSFMLALNRKTIDFFSLDVEGDEMNVLKTIPFDKLDIKMLTIEYAHGGGGGSAHQMQSFMAGKGYEVILKVSKDDWGVNDLIFRKKGLTH